MYSSRYDNDVSLLSTDMYVDKAFSVCLIFILVPESASSPNVNVYGPVPDLSPSTYYSFRVKEVSETKWLQTFALVTECTYQTMCNNNQISGNGIFNHLENWTNTYINFEMMEGTPVEIEITKLWGDEQTIEKAVVHPEKAALSCDIG